MNFFSIENLHISNVLLNCFYYLKCLTLINGQLLLTLKHMSELETWKSHLGLNPRPCDI